jgi:hypothetical protein
MIEINNDVIWEEPQDSWGAQPKTCCGCGRYPLFHCCTFYNQPACGDCYPQLVAADKRDALHFGNHVN